MQSGSHPQDHSQHGGHKQVKELQNGQQGVMPNRWKLAVHIRMNKTLTKQPSLQPRPRGPLTIQTLGGAQGNQQLHDVQTNRKSPEPTEPTYWRYPPIEWNQKSSDQRLTLPIRHRRYKKKEHSQTWFSKVQMIYLCSKYTLLTKGDILHFAPSK